MADSSTTSVGYAQPMNTAQKPSKYLVCVDDSDVSRMALRFACFKARKRGILIDILHVIPPGDMQALSSVKEKMEQEKRLEAEELMTACAEEAHTIIDITPQLIIREGKIAEQILAQTMEDYDANMLVLGVTPGKTHGKVCSYLLQRMGEELLIPMLLVPSNLTDEQMDALG